jgi:hypothetical protein
MFASSAMSVDRLPNRAIPRVVTNADGCASRKRARLLQILDLLAEDNRLNVYAGEREVRPPCAPTTEPHEEAIDRL